MATDSDTDGQDKFVSVAPPSTVNAVHDAGRPAGSVDTNNFPELQPVMHSPAVGQARNWPDSSVVDVVQADAPPSGLVDVYTDESGPFAATAAHQLTVGQVTVLTAYVSQRSCMPWRGARRAGRCREVALLVRRDAQAVGRARHESMPPVGIVALSMASGALHTSGGLAQPALGLPLSPTSLPEAPQPTAP
jgi:hypothetical protein